MQRIAERLVLLWCLLIAGTAAAHAEESQLAAPAMDSAMQAAMAKMQELGSPSEGHKALESFVGSWTYTGQFWMSPDGPPQTMTGTTMNTLIFGGRFLKQEFTGGAMMEGQPPFEGLGIVGYDNMRKEYQTVWFDNMATGMMQGTAQFDAAAKTLTEQGDFSCPMTGETHRKMRTTWKVLDANHTTYESYMSTPDGKEFKAMEIRYTRS